MKKPVNLHTVSGSFGIEMGRGIQGRHPRANTIYPEQHQFYHHHIYLAEVGVISTSHTWHTKGRAHTITWILIGDWENHTARVFT